MGEAEVLLRSLTGDVAQHEHPVVDAGPYFVIDPYTREITCSTRKHYIMQYDHNSEIYTFELPRYIDGHDMMFCNRVKVHYNNIAEENHIENTDVVDATPLQLNDDETAVVCSWSIDRNATQLVGILSFGLQYQCVTGTGEVVYEWHTDIYSNVNVKASQNNSERAISEYSDILEQWRAKLFGAGDSVMANIDSIADEQIAAIISEGNSRVNTVASEGATQVKAVNDTGIARLNEIDNRSNSILDAIQRKGEETLATIPEDYTTTHNMAEEALWTKANAIELEAEGETIFVNDSSNSSIPGFKVFGRTAQFTTTGKNLVDLSSFEFDDDDYIHSHVYSSSEVANELFNFLKNNVGKEIVLSADVTGVPSGVDIGSIRFYDQNNELIYLITPGKSMVIKAPIGEFRSCYVYGSTTGASAKNYQIEYGSVVTEYEPYTGGKSSPNPEYPQELISIENPVVSISGKNFVNVPESYTYTQFGMVDVNIPAGEYIFSFESETHTGDKSSSVRFLNNDAWKPFDYASKNMHITLVKDETQLYFYSNGTAYNGSAGHEATIKRFMVSKEGGVYEAYKEPKNLTVTYTLPGIPVTSGGNYTDSNGQQWICDEVDFGRGVYIKRVGEVILDETRPYKINSYQLTTRNRYLFECYPGNAPTAESDFPAMSDRLTYASWGSFNTEETESRLYATSGRIVVFLADQTIQTVEAFQAYLANNPIRVLYMLDTPIETPLTAEEIAAFNSAKTNHPNTTILNDAGAWMKVKYNADTKTYVDKPKSLRLTDTSTGVVYELKIVDGNLTVSPV